MLPWISLDLRSGGSGSCSISGAPSGASEVVVTSLLQELRELRGRRGFRAQAEPAPGTQRIEAEVRSIGRGTRAHQSQPVHGLCRQPSTEPATPQSTDANRSTRSPVPVTTGPPRWTAARSERSAPAPRAGRRNDPVSRRPERQGSARRAGAGPVPSLRRSPVGWAAPQATTTTNSARVQVTSVRLPTREPSRPLRRRVLQRRCPADPRQTCERVGGASRARPPGGTASPRWSRPWCQRRRPKSSSRLRQ